MNSNDHPIARMRKKAGLTQSELADLVEVSENTIANWEKGKASKWIHNINKLCAILGCDLEDLDSEIISQETFEPTLTAEIRKTVGSYCLALSQENHKEVAKIASFATLYDPQLRFWINQARSIWDDWQEKRQDQIDFEIIINSLVLQDFCRKLNNIFPNQITIDDFSRITKEIELSKRFLNRYVCYDEDNFLRKLICKTRGIYIFVTGWEPEQISLMHHHGNVLSAIWVIEGQMSHWKLSLEEGNKKHFPHESSHHMQDQDRQYRGEQSERINKGQWVFVDRNQYHQIANFTDEKLSTLHIRLGEPPEDPMWVQELSEEKPIIIGQLIRRVQLFSSY